MTLARGHGSAQVCALTPRECAEMAAVLVLLDRRLRDAARAYGETP